MYMWPFFWEHNDDSPVDGLPLSPTLQPHVPTFRINTWYYKTVHKPIWGRQIMRLSWLPTLPGRWSNPKHCQVGKDRDWENLPEIHKAGEKICGNVWVWRQSWGPGHLNFEEKFEDLWRSDILQTVPKGLHHRWYFWPHFCQVRYAAFTMEQGRKAGKLLQLCLEQCRIITPF